jgi:lipopolysaccharide export system permease protein
MRLLDRYVFREAVKVLGLCLVLFIGIYVIVDLFDRLSRFLEARASVETIVRLYLLRLPRIVIEVLPVAVLLACLLSLGGMARNNEILAMKMGQVGSLRIALPCLALGLLASAAAWGINEYIAPRASERALNIERTDIRKLPAHRTMKDSDIWYRAQGDRFIHIDLIETQSGTIRGMSVFELAPAGDLVRRIDAREASWGPKGWVLRNGYQLELTTNPIRITPFRQLTVGLSETPEQFARVARSPEEMSYGQLQEYINRLLKSGVSATRYIVDLHAKIAIVFVSLVMAILGVSFGLRTSRAGIMIWVGLCIPMGFLYYMLLSLGISLGRGGLLPPLIAPWIPNLVFGTAGIVSLWRLRG